MATILTIDGPAGCGKSTVARGVARELGGLAFNTGAIYRAVTWLAVEDRVCLDDEDAVLELLDGHRMQTMERAGELRVLVDGDDPGAALQSPEVTREIHWIADSARLRERLLPIQRQLSVTGIVVAEGRDLGTVVYPHAAAKVFLTASVEERARRRHRELEERLGRAIDFGEVLEDVKRRDGFDEDRPVAPLRAADDARVVDATDLTAEQAVAAIVKGLPEHWPD